MKTLFVQSWLAWNVCWMNRKASRKFPYVLFWYLNLDQYFRTDSAFLFWVELTCDLQGGLESFKVYDEGNKTWPEIVAICPSALYTEPHQQQQQPQQPIDSVSACTIAEGYEVVPTSASSRDVSASRPPTPDTSSRPGPEITPIAAPMSSASGSPNSTTSFNQPTITQSSPSMPVGDVSNSSPSKTFERPQAVTFDVSISSITDETSKDFPGYDVFIGKFDVCSSWVKLFF